MQKKRARFKLSAAQVQQLLDTFHEVKAGTSAVQTIIGERTEIAFAANTLIEADFIQGLDAITIPVQNQLRQYTEGFRTFSRSMARKKQEPDDSINALLEKTRVIRPQAEQLLSDFEWTVHNIHERIVIHNSIVNAQQPSAIDETISTELDAAHATLAPAGAAALTETAPGDRPEGKGDGQDGEGL